MIQPVQSGRTLLDDIADTRLRRGQVAIWWLGQSGYAIKTASALLYIDLYLSEHLTAKYAGTEKPHIRMTESPLKPDEISNAAWMFATHRHSDHLDPGTIPGLFAASPQARLVLPLALVDHSIVMGVAQERLIPTRGDETIQVGPVTVQSIPASHPGFDYTQETGYPFLSFGFEVDGLRLFHSGDTVVYDGLAERLRAFKPDIVFLPINGTDARREALKVAPNMNAEEAVALAKAAGARLVIPHHYDMFTFNTADVGEFERIARERGQDYAVLRCGERFCWQRYQMPLARGKRGEGE
jgi:L-ascorbate metabolism protein UlaG (beta-lactamase superfamily)